MSLKDLLDAVNGTQSDAPKREWLKIEADTSVEIVFLQELDTEADNYDEARGIGKIVDEVVDPDDFRRKCADTRKSEGRSYGWEMYNKLKDIDKDKAGKWRPKTKVYINVLRMVDGEARPAIYSFSARGDVAADLAEYAQENGTITNTVFKVTRRGKGFNSKYRLSAISGDSSGLLAKSGDEIELFDLTDIPTNVPYAEQQAFFAASVTPTVAEETADLEW